MAFLNAPIEPDENFRAYRDIFLLLGYQILSRNIKNCSSSDKVNWGSSIQHMYLDMIFPGVWVRKVSKILVWVNLFHKYDTAADSAFLRYPLGYQVIDYFDFCSIKRQIKIG